MKLHAGYRTLFTRAVQVQPRQAAQPDCHSVLGDMHASRQSSVSHGMQQYCRPGSAKKMRARQASPTYNKCGQLEAKTTRKQASAENHDSWRIQIRGAIGWSIVIKYHPPV